ncbi:hypothetical protein [Sinanaerobacter sp. ZZT-01]|uniref:hypothetical protein n=1 Tax=Sinanaerobacter sp. ZZT-01 TaxID=3111540 RepID=UPI002D77B665|nr:hypothetical protein [Sinanaerobacter sp. ZZT-01]WRR92361.1 hypothetical protein U5921_09830 [Sinanaerobacter sp. ZZT-01]
MQKVVSLDDNLIKRIHSAKQKLKTRPDSILFGELKEGEDCISDSFNCPIYCEFLKICNGARCGEIDFWGINDLLQNQFYTMDIKGGQVVWLCIGQVLYEPLMLNKWDKKVYLLRKDELDRTPPIFCFESLDDLMKNYVFGERYRNIVSDAEHDEWYIFLKENKFFS